MFIMKLSEKFIEITKNLKMFKRSCLKKRFQRDLQKSMEISRKNLKYSNNVEKHNQNDH